MDCFNGEIISLEMRSNMRKELCTDTFNAAAKRFPQLFGGAEVGGGTDKKRILVMMRIGKKCRSSTS